MKLAGVVVLYHPDDSVYSNILSYAGELDVLYVVDNTDLLQISDEEKQVISKILMLKNVKYKSFGENLGISCAINYAIRNCESYKYLLTMDQDSSFEPGDVHRYKEKIERIDRRDIAVFAVREGGERKAIEPDKFEKRVITSGSIMELDITRKIGGLDEKLFIDSVDFEYCYRAAKNGYKILRFGDIVLNHRLGEEETVKKWGGGEHVLHVHDATRRYYITRNNIYLLRKYPRRNFSKFKKIFKDLRLILLYENNKRRKLKAWAYGAKDGILGNMGKCHHTF